MSGSVLAQISCACALYLFTALTPSNRAAFAVLVRCEQVVERGRHRSIRARASADLERVLIGLGLPSRLPAPFQGRAAVAPRAVAHHRQP
jgi:hypothetical protein